MNVLSGIGSPLARKENSNISGIVQEGMKKDADTIQRICNYD